MYDVIKYNYSNGRSNMRNLCIQNGRITCIKRGCCGSYELHNVIGLVHGPVTTTFKNKLEKKMLVVPYLCLSFIAQNRTYDYQFLSIESLKLFLEETYNILPPGNITWKRLHYYTTEYIDFCIQVIESNRINYMADGIKAWNDSLIRYRWDINNNSPYNNSMVYPGTIINSDCCICITDFIDKDLCYKLPCGHGLHMECAKMFFSSHNNNEKCPLCRADIIYNLITYVDQ